MKGVIVIGALVFLSGCARSQGTTAAASRLDPPVLIEPFAATDLDGQDRSPATWAGKAVVINVWATWCGPCRREIPALAALQRKFGSRLLVIGLLEDNVTDDDARVFARSAGLTYPIVRERPEIEHRLPAVLALPMTFLIDRTGHLTTMFVGEIDPSEVESELARLLKDTAN